MPRQIGTRKIGNYIHFYHSNYLKYGIGTREQGRIQESISKVLADQKNLILEQSRFSLRNANITEIKDNIEKRLNYFRPEGSFDGKIKVSPNEIENKIRDLVIHHLKLENASIDWDNLQVLDVGDSFNIERAKIANTKNKARNKLDEESGRNSIDSIEKRLETLQKTKENLQKKIPEQADALDKALTTLWNEWREIEKTFEKVTRYGRQYILGANNFIKDLNELWNKFSKEVNSYLTGVLGEEYAAISALAYKYFAKNTGQNLISDFEKYIMSLSDSNMGLEGKHRSASILSSRFFATTGKNQNIKSSHFISGNLFNNFFGGKSKIVYTQDKVDLNISLDQIDTIAASVKNYNLSSGYNISVHTGISILVLSQEYTNFINHYLNITVQHPDSSSLYIAQMNNMLKLTLGLKAIAGGIFKFTKEGGLSKNKAAEILVLNDSSGKYKVYFIQDLIDKIANDINLLEVKGLDSHKTWQQWWVDNTNGIAARSNSNYSFSNPNYRDAYSRINGILSQLHNFKLDISVKPKIFQN